jgi:dihydrofolate reductase
MRKVVLFIASSLDGYIATTSGDVDWLFTDQDYGYTDFFALIDTVLIGRRTYEQILSFGEYPYKGTLGFVFSRTHSGERDDNVTFVSNDIKSFVESLKGGTGKDIWLVGGASIIQSCLQHDLIDEFVISTHPIILGDGIPLFRTPLPMRKLSFQRCETFDTGLLQLTYVRRPPPDNA